eukprot:TRINITY_DN3080_c0_g1_i2.p2 TRINITY_DN3080_c0_g1~~TRINITY_DN3080_c0_g1_i2.p2  ORF type:complete len:126 (-),score=12.95 TRINITY_DN3080_c0_g1_i2:817-1152(-)
MVAPKRRDDLSARSGIRNGLNPGHVTTRRNPTRAGQKRHIASSKKTKLNAVRAIVSEVVGLAPYERRVVQLLQVQREKRALRFLKRRLGTHRRAVVKREKLGEVMRRQKKQ